jgi:hypothetical protein
VTVAGSASAAWAPITTLAATITSGTQLTVNVPANMIQQDGPLAFSISVPDGSGIGGHTLSGSATYAISPPSSVAIAYPGQPFSTLAGSAVNVASTNSDPNVLNWQASGLPGGVSINPTTGALTGTILDSDSFGTYPVVITAVDDGVQGSDSFNWTVTGPTISSLSKASVTEGSGSFTLTIEGHDFQAHGNASVTVSGSSSATWAPAVNLTPTILGDATLTVNLPANILQQDGPLTVTVTVPDASGIAGHTLRATTTLTINPPTSVTVTYPGQPFNTLAGGSVNVASTNSDPNVINWQASGLPGGVSINPTTGALSGTILDSDSFGTYPVVITAMDDGVQGSDSFNWTVVGPTVSGLSPTAVTEGSGSFKLAITGSDFQAHGNATVTVSGSSSATWAPAVNLTPIILSDSNLTVNVPANMLQQDGPLTVTVLVPDGSGIAGHALSAAASLIINPPASLNFQYPNELTLEGRPASAGSNNTDPNVGNWQATGLPPGLAIKSDNGTISGTASLGSVGVYTVTVTATDDGIVGTDTFTWKVTGPTITSLNPTAEPEGSGSFTLTVVGTDFQNNGNATVNVSGSALTPTILNDSTLTVNVPGNLLQQNGPLLVNVIVPDGSGIPGNTLSSGTASFTIAPPVSLSFAYANQETLDGAGVDVFSDNTDPNVKNWQATGLPPGLLINSNTGEITGTISAGAEGDYTVTVTAVNDGTKGSDTFDWTVEPPNQAPSFNLAAVSVTASQDGGPNPVAYSAASFTTNIVPGPKTEFNQQVNFLLSTTNASLFTSTGQPTITLNGAAPNYPLTGNLTFTIASNVTSGNAP